MKKRLSLEVLTDDSVVSDKRKSLHDNLSAVARVGQCFDIALHTRRKYKLARFFTVGTEGKALEHGPVGKHKITLLFHFCDHSFLKLSTNYLSFDPVISECLAVSGVQRLPSIYSN